MAHRELETLRPSGASGPRSCRRTWTRRTWTRSTAGRRSSRRSRSSRAAQTELEDARIGAARAPQRGAARRHARETSSVRRGGDRERSPPRIAPSSSSARPSSRRRFAEPARSSRRRSRRSRPRSADAIATQRSRPRASASRPSRPPPQAELEALQQEIADRDARYGDAEQAVAGGQGGGERVWPRSWRRPSVELETTIERLTAETAGRTRAHRSCPSARSASCAETGDAREPPRGRARRRDAGQRRPQPPAPGGGGAPRTRDRRPRGSRRPRRAAARHAGAPGRPDREADRRRGPRPPLGAGSERAKVERIDEVEGELRHVQMAEAMRQIRGEGDEGRREPEEASSRPRRTGVPIEDRRATTPFMQGALARRATSP